MDKIISFDLHAGLVALLAGAMRIAIAEPLWRSCAACRSRALPLTFRLGASWRIRN